MESDENGESMVRFLRGACEGDQDALGRLLDLHRGYLRAIAQRELRGKLNDRMDVSDLVQRTCLSAVRDFSKFDGNKIAQFVAWLRRIHERNLRDAVREHQGAARRSLEREERPTADWVYELASCSGTSASARALADERAVLLTAALDRLPEAQREAVRLRHLDGMTLAEIAAEIGRSEVAVAGLLKRGMRSLRSTLLGRDEVME